MICRLGTIAVILDATFLSLILVPLPFNIPQPSLAVAFVISSFTYSLPFPRCVSSPFALHLVLLSLGSGRADDVEIGNMHGPALRAACGGWDALDAGGGHHLRVLPRIGRSQIRRDLHQDHPPGCTVSNGHLHIYLNASPFSPIGRLTPGSLCSRDPIAFVLGKGDGCSYCLFNSWGLCREAA